MLDMRLLREEDARVRAGIAHKGGAIDLDEILALDQERRDLLVEAEALRHKRKESSKEIGRVAQAGGDIAAAKEAMRAVGGRISELDAQLKEVETRRDRLLLGVPNLPHESVPVGSNADSNRLVRSWGEQRSFDFEPRPHWDIGELLGIIDFQRAARMTGAGFPMLCGLGARLQRALIQFMLDLHVNEHGYREVLPPFLCNAAAMTGTGQLPKMEEDMYRLPDDGLYLIPTAEVPVTNIYREEIIDEELPIKLTAYTPCFRREAGAAGRDTRGLIRLHQFDKVEMVKFVEPEGSFEELEKLLAEAEDVLQRLGLHYRVLELCTGDLSFAAAKCYDIELWAPGYGDWLEVSSCSNFADFQARRAGIRYRNSEGRTEFVHTLNGSGVALPRLMVALLENGQNEDGSVELPEALWPYMGGIRRIG
jgi:seryl-tRNA synthetase